jgi:signal transduction histidine kinase
VSEKIMRASKLQFALSLFWFLFTFSLVVWWWVFSLHQLELLSEVVEQVKHQSIKRMLIWEGAVLVVAVFVGGLTLVILTNRERQRNLRLRNFFSNFTHDLKTSLTRLRLRTEMLAEKNSSPEVQKLLEEASRLDLQLENSLWVARGDTHKLISEDISLSQSIGFLRVEWPELEVRLHQDALLLADGQALKSVFRNVFQNAWLHGEATKIDIKPILQNNAWTIEIEDNGKGFSGDLKQLGAKLLSSKSERGNGLGLFLTNDLIKRMNGQIKFLAADKGFKLQIVLPASQKVKHG